MVRVRLILVTLVALALGGTALAAWAAPGPTGPGNNGTVKIDLVPIDDTSPQNEPHVGCPFGVDWYGFDVNARTTVEFRIWPPSNATGGREILAMNVLDSNGAFLGQTTQDSFNLDADGPAGGGSQAGWDGGRHYDLTPGLLPYGQPAAGQGYHVKMTVLTQTSRGADVKHKVFWTALCDTGTDGGPGGVTDGVTGSE